MVCLAALLLSVASQAQSVPDRRAEAVALWLSDQELEGLHALSGLARGGDAWAQLLLGLIDKTSEMQGPELIALPRSDRLALMRAPGGISGRNWVHVAAEQGTPHALAWKSLWSVRADLQTAETFATLQEPQAVAETLLTLVKRGETGFSPAVLDLSWYPQKLAFLSRPHAIPDVLGAGLHPGDPQRRHVYGVTPDPTALRDWLAESPVAAPLRAACDVVCTDSAAACSYALYQALGSYEVLLTLGSPVNAVISNAEFADSPRGRAVLARRIMLMRSTRMREAALDKLVGIDVCASDWLAMQFDRHTPRKIAAP